MSSSILNIGREAEVLGGRRRQSRYPRPWYDKLSRYFFLRLVVEVIREIAASASIAIEIRVDLRWLEGWWESGDSFEGFQKMGESDAGEK